MKHKKKKTPSTLYNKVLLLCIFTIICASLVALFLSGITSHSPEISQITQKKNLDELSKVEYSHISQELERIVVAQDPQAALTRLTELMDSNPKILRGCHGLVHDVGHFAFDKYKDFATALTYQDDLCGSGYLHGIIEAYFKSAHDLYSASQTVCSPYTGMATAGKCYHGVGHGFMYYTNNNVPLSISLCDKYTETSAKIQCSEGVFMENFNSNEEFHYSKYLKPSDPFFPCNDQTFFYKDSCYFYAPDYYLHLYSKDYSGAVEWCKTPEKSFILKCFNGLGSRTMKQNLNNPQFAENICMKSQDPSQIASCIDGAISYYLVNYNSLSKAREFCKTLDESNQAACLYGVNKRTNLFMN